MKILFLTRYGQQGASSRMRCFQFLPSLNVSGIESVVVPFFVDETLKNKYRHGRYSWRDLLLVYWRRINSLLGKSQFDLIWIEKEALPWFPAWFELLLLRGKPYVMDFDDALFHNYDKHPNGLIRSLYGRRIDHLMAGARLVVAGNRYLADRAIAAGAQWVEVLPTVVDLARYETKQVYRLTQKPRIVWIGSPSTVQYLLELAEPLSILAKRQAFTLRVIGGGALIMPGVDVESLPWSLDTEATMIAECDIGIMPLRDTPWEQGKCAYKLIQYMACGLPTAATPIGANREVVMESETGFFADTPAAWLGKLEVLLCDVTLRQQLGQAGRLRVEVDYCLQEIAPRWRRILIDIGGDNEAFTV